MAPGTNSLHIAHVISALGTGGMENIVANLAGEQKRRGYDVHVICIRDFGPTSEKLKRKEVPFYLCHFKSRLHPGSVRELKNLFEELKINVVQTHNYRPNVSGTISAKFAKIPVILSTLHTVNRWDTFRQYMMDRLLCRMRDAIVCVSAEVRDQYQYKTKCPDEKLHVIHNGVPSHYFELTPPDNGFYEKHGINPREQLILSVARMVPVKDHVTLLKAFKKVVSEVESVKLLLVGDGPLRDDLEKLAEQSGIKDKVYFAGYQYDMENWLAAADMAVLSSHVEGLPCFVVEAMAAGLPVVATAVGGTLETLVDGESGFFAPQEDSDYMAKRIISLLKDDDLKKRLSENASRKARKDFSIESMCDKSISLYKEILSGKGIKLNI